MLPSQRKILEILQKHSPITMSELHLLTGYTRDSIRGRISEIRKRGYDIKQLNGKYYLYDGNLDIEKVISYVASRNLYGLRIEVDKLIDELDISREDLTNVLSKLYGRKQLFQWAKDVVVIYHPLK